MTDIKTRSAVELRIKQLADANGGQLTPEMLIEDARDSSSPLHSEFEWNDAEAAHQWRIEQARALIRSVKYVFHVENHAIAAPAYVRNPEADAREQGYISVERIRRHEDMQRDVLVSEFKRASDVLARARRLATLFGMTDEVDGFLRELEITRARASEARMVSLAA